MCDKLQAFRETIAVALSHKKTDFFSRDFYSVFRSRVTFVSLLGLIWERVTALCTTCHF